MQLTYVDCLLYPAQTNTKDLENLAFFGTKTALLAASLDEKERIFERWERLCSSEVERVSRAGVAPLIALGLAAENAPKQSWRELLSQLEGLLSQPKVKALGPLSLGTLPRHEEALLTQLQMAAKRGLPCLIALPQRGRLPYIEATLSLCKKAGLPSEKVAFLHSTGKSVVRARAAGAHSVLTVHPSYLKTKAAAALLQRQGADKILLASGLGVGAGDVLALQKLTLLLGEGALSGEEILQVTHKNALQLFGLSQE